MKIKLYLLCAGLFFCTQRSGAQFIVADPMHIATSIINSITQVVETSTTASNMIKNFGETVKIYEQGKEYYDKLKAVHGLVKDARKVQQTILMVGEVTDIYMTSFQKMMADPYFTVEELAAIARGYTILLEESGQVLNDLKDAVNENGMSMSDKERIDLVDKAYNSMLEYRHLVRYYTRKNIGVSYLRAQKQQDTERILQLYGTPEERYW